MGAHCEQTFDRLDKMCVFFLETMTVCFLPKKRVTQHFYTMGFGFFFLHIKETYSNRYISELREAGRQILLPFDRAKTAVYLFLDLMLRFIYIIAGVHLSKKHLFCNAKKYILYN